MNTPLSNVNCGVCGYPISEFEIDRDLGVCEVCLLERGEKDLVVLGEHS